MNKITRKYEDEDTISIWTYDADRFKNGPISVEIIDKKPEPTSDLQMQVVKGKDKKFRKFVRVK